MLKKLGFKLKAIVVYMLSKALMQDLKTPVVMSYEINSHLRLKCLVSWSVVMSSCPLVF